MFTMLVCNREYFHIKLFAKLKMDINDYPAGEHKLTVNGFTSTWISPHC